jgi:hypothetical protein
VGPIKSLWASVQGDPVFTRRVNGWLTLFWIAMIPVSLLTGWVNSVVYVSALSLWALVSGHWSAWQAARVEVKQHEEAQAAKNAAIAAEVVERSSKRRTFGKPQPEPTPWSSPGSPDFGVDRQRGALICWPAQRKLGRC